MAQLLTFDDVIHEDYKQEGRQEGKLEMTESLIQDGFDDAFVSKHSGLSSDEVSEIRRKLGDKS